MLSLGVETMLGFLEGLVPELVRPASALFGDVKSLCESSSTHIFLFCSTKSDELKHYERLLLYSH